MNLKDKLQSIRELIDVETFEADVDAVSRHAQELAAMLGLSAECKAEARRKVEESRLIALRAIIGDKKITPSVMLKMADGAIAEELQIFEYADRLNAGLTHKMDLLRSVISLRKTELENSRFQN